MARKRNPKLSQREQEDAVILKYINGEPMTLEETALAMWMRDGRPEKGPMTRMGMLKQEQKILIKLRKACEKMGLSKADVLDVFQMFDGCKHSSANGNYANSIDEN